MDLRRSKPVLALVGLVALVSYLVILELGVNAGRVHRGVSVAGYDLGGLTFPEAKRSLARHADMLSATDLVFVGDGFECSIAPREVRWSPRVGKTVAQAMKVGREGGLVQATTDRFRAWTEGVDVPWPGDVAEARLDRSIDECAATAEDAGSTIDEAALASEVRDALTVWPREAREIPPAG